MENYENTSAFELINTYNNQVASSGYDSHTDHTDYDDYCDHDDSGYHVDSDSFGGTHDDVDGDLSGWGFGHDDC